MDSTEELEAFKTQINLTEYAAGNGYRIDRRGSTRGSVVMGHDNGDKVVITRDSDGHWIYFSVRDDCDNGTIIDFCQNRQGVGLGEVRKILRPWVGIGDPVSLPPSGSFVSEVAATFKDRQAVLRTWHKARVAERHPFLESRGLKSSLLGEPQFADRIRIDQRGNALFPHYDGRGLCGIEIKNRGFTSFSAGGEKGLWLSRAQTPTQMIVCESAIDALSYAQLHPDRHARYASTAGAWGPRTAALLHACVERDRCSVVLAFDNDDQGRGYAAKARSILASTGVEISESVPAAKDWNAMLNIGRGV